MTTPTYYNCDYSSGNGQCVAVDPNTATGTIYPSLQQCQSNCYSQQQCLNTITSTTCIDDSDCFDVMGGPQCSNFQISNSSCVKSKCTYTL